MAESIQHIFLLGFTISAFSTCFMRFATTSPPHSSRRAVDLLSVGTNARFRTNQVTSSITVAIFRANVNSRTVSLIGCIRESMHLDCYVIAYHVEWFEFCAIRLCCLLFRSIPQSAFLEANNPMLRSAAKLTSYTASIWTRPVPKVLQDHRFLQSQIKRCVLWAILI